MQGKHKEIQWRVAESQKFLYTSLLYQVMTNRIINAATSL